MRKLAFLSILLLAFNATSAFAIDLLGVYQQALTSDPAFQQAHAQWLSDREDIAISRATLLPQFTIAAGFGRTLTDRDTTSGYVHYYNNASTYSLTLDQQIFNYQNWAQLNKAKSSVKASAATYSAAAQDLMYRTAEAYFNVLQAQDVLRYTLAEKRSIARQLEQQKQRYNVGLIAITAVYQAQASYDSIAAEAIAAQNSLANQKEKLREITGQQYQNFATITSSLPLVYPTPGNINQWVKVAEGQNYTLLASNFTAHAALENIKAERAGRYPTLAAQGTYGFTHNSNSADVGVKNSHAATLGLSLNFPVLQGGAINAQTRQAEYDYQKALAALEQSKRTTISDTRQAYLGVLSGISKIKADKQAIVSNRSALKATEAAYIVGTSTMVDVLNVQSDLYKAQKDYATDEYAYLLQTLALKQAAGTLSLRDLQQINSWLHHSKFHSGIKKIHVVKSTKHKRIKRTVMKKATKKQVAKKQTKNTPITIKQELLKINPRHYSIQLTASHDKAAILQLLDHNKIQHKAFCYATKRNGKTWYKLIVGDFATRKQAETAGQHLPLAVRKLHPWVREFKSIQKEL